MAQTSQTRIIPIYKSNGEVGAYLVYPYLFNTSGEWMGWVTNDRQVYSVLGAYVGQLSNDPRIIRRMSEGDDKPRKSPPPRPAPIKTPATVPLAPMMSDLPFGVTDVLLDEPERLHTRDTGDMLQDLD